MEFSAVFGGSNVANLANEASKSSCVSFKVLSVLA
jgi:hypothetical protein